MGGIPKAIGERLVGYAPVERILSTYVDRKKFYKEMGNYLVGGLVISCSKFFLMTKPIDSTKDPSAQWWPKDPDCWYVRWAAGKDCMSIMFDAVEPLPKLMFRRIKPGGESGLKVLNWDRMYKRVCHE